MTILKDLGVLFTVQKFIIIPNYGLLSDWNPLQLKLVTSIRILPFVIFIGVDFFQVFVYKSSHTEGFSEFSRIAYIVSEFDFIMMKIIMGIVAVSAIIHNQRHIGMLHHVEDYQQKFIEFMTKPKASVKFLNNAKFILSIIQMVLMNTVVWVLEEAKYRTDSPLWFFFYSFSIVIADTVSFYIASMARILGDILVKAGMKINTGKISLNQKILSFDKDSLNILTAFSATFGIMLFVTMTTHFISSCISTFFLIWLLSTRHKFDYKYCYVLACTIWVLRSFIFLLHIAAACDHFCSALFHYQVTLNRCMSDEQGTQIHYFNIHLFQLKKLHHDGDGVKISALGFFNINKSSIFACVVSYNVILMQFRQLEGNA
uniref:Uncharacterized protein n=1 Tax=Phlebotomus papatasi TaxID=29031 RepID=A0A3F2ZEJ9_PHLPP